MPFWFVVAGLIVTIALALAAGRARRRRSSPEIEPVTKEWLAQAASREDHIW